MKEKEEEKNNRYSYTVVRHKKNIQRTLNKLFEHCDVITMYQMESNAWVINRKVNNPKTTNPLKVQKLQELTQVIFDRFEYEKTIKDTKALIKVVKGIFEYPQYHSALIQIISSYEETITLQEHNITQNRFFLQDEKTILSELQTELQKIMKTDLSSQFIKRLYSSLHNRIKFPILYATSYEESKASDFSTMKSSSKKSLYSNYLERLIKNYYEYYKEYAYLISLRKEFNFYFDKNNEGYAFPENDNTALEWREKYFFLIKYGIWEKLFECIDQLYKFIEPFLEDETVLVDLRAVDGRSYETAIEDYLKDNNIDVKYNVESMTKIYRALYKYIGGNVLPIIEDYNMEDYPYLP